MAQSKRKSYLTLEDEKSNVVEHFECVQSRIEDFIKQGKGLVSVLKKRVSVDKDHVKGVQKMVQSIHDDAQTKHMKFQGSMDTLWNSVKEQLATEAMHISRVTSTLEQQALQPLQIFLLADLEKRFRGAVQDGRKTVKEYSNSKLVLQKNMERYYGLASEWESCLLAIYQEQGDSWNPAPGNKLHEREMQLSRKVVEGKEDYEAAVEQVNLLQQDVFSNQLPKVLDNLRTIAENMVAVVNNALRSFSDMQVQLLSGNGTKGSQCLDQFNAAEYCQVVIFSNVVCSLIPLPPTYEFQEFPFKDETLMIQARKVQYMCMSKLSPKELASRAHQFLTEGDKKKSQPAKVISFAQEEGCRLLIPMCLEYLKQPIALKEEGLFRVSGDSCVMKSLHADFIGGKATKEFLRAAVMEQRDPNTISGLLKLHLRERPFLCPRSIAQLDKVLQARDKEEILPTVMEELTSNEINILTDVTGLLNMMVQQPWRAQNKMSAHTLGIACGLSLFPNLDPSKATSLTEYMITNYDSLKGSHSLL